MACVEENARLNPQELADSEAKHIQKLEELDEDDSDDSGPTVTNEDCSSYVCFTIGLTIRAGSDCYKNRVIRIHP